MKRQRLSPGFTLIEVLLVILLIGLLASAVVINFSGDSRDKKLETQTGQLQQLVQIASETAMLKQQELGLFINNEGYRFMLFQDDKWHSIREPKSLRPRQFPPGYKIALELEGLEWSDGNLLSQIEWQEEDDSLFEENSFDQREAEKLKQAAAEGKTALKHTQEQHFDLLILDVMLPGLNGVANRITQRALHSLTPAYRGSTERGRERFVTLNPQCVADTDLASHRAGSRS